MSKSSRILFLFCLVFVFTSLFAGGSDFASFEVAGYVTFTLNDSTKTAEFKKAADEFIQVWNDNVPGSFVKIMQADRGSAKGSYIMLLCFDTKATRDSYWPEQGKSSEKLKAIYEKHPEINEKDQKMMEYMTYQWHGDFIDIK